MTHAVLNVGWATCPRIAQDYKNNHMKINKPTAQRWEKLTILPITENRFSWITSAMCRIHQHYQLSRCCQPPFTYDQDFKEIVHSKINLLLFTLKSFQTCLIYRTQKEKMYAFDRRFCQKRHCIQGIPFSIYLFLFILFIKKWNVIQSYLHLYYIILYYQYYVKTKN